MGFDSQRGQQWPPQQQQPWGQQPQPQWQPDQWQPPGQQPPTRPSTQWGPPPQPPAQKPQGKKGSAKAGCGIIAGIAGAIFVLVAILTSHGSSPSASSPAAPPARPQAAAPSTVTYVVTGSSAQVTYGPAGSGASGSVPMRKTAAIPATPPGYYSIDAQLQGSGSVSCEILVGSTVVSKATASGSYNIASCEIIQDPLSGAWQDANAG